jgi:hypothetical protein
MEETSIPATPVGLASAFRQSSLWQTLETNITSNRTSNQYDSLKNFDLGVAEGKRKHASKKSIFSAPFHKQVWGNIKQLTRLRWSAKLPLYSFAWTWLTIPLIVSSLVYKFSDSSNDTFSRVSWFRWTPLRTTINFEANFGPGWSDFPLVHDGKCFSTRDFGFASHRVITILSSVRFKPSVKCHQLSQAEGL